MKLPRKGKMTETEEGEDGYTAQRRRNSFTRHSGLSIGAQKRRMHSQSLLDGEEKGLNRAFQKKETCTERVEEEN